MKMLINLVIVLASCVSFAQLTPACLGEAQIIAKVVNSGVEVGLINDKDCSLKAGDDLSGTLVLNSAGKIIFQ